MREPEENENENGKTDRNEWKWEILKMQYCWVENSPQEVLDTGNFTWVPHNSKKETSTYLNGYFYNSKQFYVVITFSEIKDYDLAESIKARLI